MKNAPHTRRAPPSLIGGVGAIVIAAGYVAVVMLFNLGALAVFVLPLPLFVLLVGGVGVLTGLAQKVNRSRGRVLQHAAALAAVVTLLYVLSIGPGHPLCLLDYRNRAAVALTGGQRNLQSWAVELLAKPRDDTEPDGWQEWRVPKKYWSNQVRRLGPNHVTVVRFSPAGQQWVCLAYGGGFLHWRILIGPPGSIPDPNIRGDLPDSYWFRWGDGIYDWQRY